MVQIESGELHLKAYLWIPSGVGPFPGILFNHGRSDSAEYHWRERNLTLTAAAESIGPLFAAHGYVFLFPFRRGEGPSADQAPFIGDLLQHEENAAGIQAKKHLQLVLMCTDHLDDSMAGLSFLRGLREVDAHRIAVIGHSFGGGISILQAERAPTLRAIVTFGAAAASWDGSEELRARLLAAIDKIDTPVLLIHAANDYSTAPGRTMANELARLSKPHALKVYPPVGKSVSDGHNFIYTDVSLWNEDVFHFLQENLGVR